MEERLKYLFRQYLNNSCTKKEFDEFFSYVRDAAHDDTMRDLIKKVYDESGHSLNTYVDETGKLVLTQPPARPKRPRKKLYVGIAACVLAALVFLVWPGDKPVQQQALTKKATQRSEYKYLLLPDSTQVWLNAASTLEYPPLFNGARREVYLTGEAYFDVKHADQLPFIIHTGKVSTTVLGTAFNIKAYPGREHIVVSVNRGKVRVQYDNKEVAMLIQGQQVKVSNLRAQRVEKKSLNTDAAAWQQGHLYFDDETMEDIVAELQQVYDVRIQLKKEGIRNERINTTIKRELGIGEALDVLCRITESRLSQNNGTYIIE
jgi:transmembrane sensor